MAVTREIRLDVGGTLALDVPEGRWTGTPTVIVYTPAGAVHVASANATVDTVNTTLQSAPAANATTLLVASATGVVKFRTYLLTNATGQAEWVRVRGINGMTLTIEEPIQFTHTTASTFVGVRLTTTVTAAKATPRDDGYYAEWSYTVAAQAYKERTYFDIVRSPWPDVVLQTWELKRYLGDRAADIRAPVEQQGDDFEQQLGVAAEGVRDDIEGKGLRVPLFKSFEPFKRPVAFRWLLDLARLGHGMPETWEDARGWTEHCEALYDRAIAQALNVAKVYDAGDDGTVSKAEAKTHLGDVRFYR